MFEMQALNNADVQTNINQSTKRTFVIKEIKMLVLFIKRKKIDVYKRQIHDCINENTHIAMTSIKQVTY